MRDEYDYSKGRRGLVIPSDPNKIRITIRLDADIVDYLHMFRGRLWLLPTKASLSLVFTL